ADDGTADDAPAATAEEEGRVIGEVRVPVVERAVAERTGLDPHGLCTARWDLPVVGHEAGPDRKLDVPVRPVDVRQREIGMEAERNGHRALPRGRDDRADRERGLAEARI